MAFCPTVFLSLELRHANVHNVHGGPGSLPGRVRVTSATLPAKHGAHDADKRAGKDLPLPPARDH